MNQPHSQCYEFGLFRLDAQERLLQRDGATISLTPKAFDLLLALVERHGRLVEKEELFQTVWPDTTVEESNLSSNIALIRKALSDGTNGERYIETVPKRGYRFVAEVRASQAAVNDEVATSTPLASTGAPLPQPKRWWRPALLVALGLLIGVAVWWMWSKPISPAPPMQITPFTSLPGEKMQPAFSPDGNQIAFAWRGESGGQNHVYVKQIGNETVRKLTGDPAVVTAEYSPAWSPDGRFIAFIKSTKPDAYGVAMVPSLGGVERRVSEQQFFYAGFLDWSPDGEWIVIEGNSADNKTYRLYLIAVQTGEAHQLTTPPAGIYGDKSPKFSPDGKTVVFIRADGLEDADVYTVPVTGGEPQQLTFDKTPTREPIWMADGKEILYLSSRAGGRLWRVPATGGKPVPIENAPQRIGSLAISKQGNRLAVTESFENADIWQMELGTMPAPLPQRLIYSTRNDHSPQISPDGRKIVFGSARSGKGEIWVCDSDAQNPVQLTFNGGNGSPRWSPDGRHIVYDNTSQGTGTDIYIVSIEGGQPRRMTTEPSEDMVPSWSHDGQWIYFCSGRSGSLQIWKMPAAGGAAVQVTKQGGFDNVESPDGQFLYYLKARSAPGLWRIPVAGGEETPVFEHPRAGHRRYWAVTEQGIYFATAEKPEQPLLEFFRFATGKFTEIATLEKPIFRTMPGLAVSPDGRRLIWSQVDQAGSDILLLENFH